MLSPKNPHLVGNLLKIPLPESGKAPREMDQDRLPLALLAHHTMNHKIPLPRDFVTQNGDPECIKDFPGNGPEFLDAPGRKAPDIPPCIQITIAFQLSGSIPVSGFQIDDLLKKEDSLPDIPD